jgi:diguanylate cyclase
VGQRTCTRRRSRRAWSSRSCIPQCKASDLGCLRLKKGVPPADISDVAALSRDNRLDPLHFLIETQRLVNAGPADVDRIMSLVAQRAQAACLADGATIELADGDDMVVQAVTGKAADLSGQRAPLEYSVSGQCARFGMPLLSRDTDSDSRVDAVLAREHGIRSLAAAPIVQGGEGIGVLKVLASQPDHFDDADGDVLELMANLVTASLKSSSGSLFELDAQNPLQDPLTGVANRVLLMDRLGQQVYEARRYGRPFGLFVIDIEHFATINETLGREGGDTVLRAVGRGLNGTVRSGDTLARLEADQFVILCGNAERSVVEERLKGRIQTVMDAVNQELSLDGISIEASVGVVWSSGNDASAESLLTAAAAALYRVKRQHYAALVSD